MFSSHNRAACIFVLIKCMRFLCARCSVIEEAAHNLMDSYNIAVCMSPAIAQDSSCAPVGSSHEVLIQLVQRLVEQQAAIFGVYPADTTPDTIALLDTYSYQRVEHQLLSLSPASLQQVRTHGHGNVLNLAAWA